jgi:hypothetical protein
MLPNSPLVLVLGAGSVGRRHLQNLAADGCRLCAFDPRGDRLAEAAAGTPLVFASTAFSDFEACQLEFDGVVIASPPSFHVQQLKWAVSRGIPVLLEKPLSKTASEAEEALQAVRAMRGRVLLGYTYRWWEPLRDFRELLRSSVVGRPIHVQCVMSAHLADWHPWEPYTDFFMASSELGGGALLDESHFIDLLLWIFGMPSAVHASVRRLSTLRIETDDNVDAILDFPGGLRATLHLDLYGRPHEKWIRATCEGGSIHWSFDPNEVSVCTAAGQEWSRQAYRGVRNDMFLACSREFIAMMRGECSEPTCTISDGVAVLRVVEAIRRSEAGGRREAVQ